MAKHIDGVLQGGEPVVLSPAPRVTVGDLIGALKACHGWATARMVWRQLPIDKRAAVSVQNLHRSLRKLQQAGTIDRLSYGSGPEYRMKGIEE